MGDAPPDPAPDPDPPDPPDGKAPPEAERETAHEERQSKRVSEPRLSVRDVAKRRTLAAKALGVDKDAGRKTVAKAFRKVALDEHPDKGGEKARFQVINEAYMKMRQPQTPTARR